MQLALVGIAVYAALIVLIGIRLFVLERKLRIFFGRGKEKNMEALVYQHATLLDTLRQESAALKISVESLNRHFLDSVQKMGMVRFNPFSESGGDQSFSIVLLDGNNNGFVLSGLYMQGKHMVYAKPIEKGESRYTLSGEEHEALKKALNT